MRQLLALWQTHGGIFCVLNGRLSPSWLRINLPSVQGVSTCRAHQNPLEGFLKHRVLGPAPEGLIQWVGVGPENLHVQQGHRFCGWCHSMDHTTSSFILVCLRAFQIFQDSEWGLHFFPQSSLLQVKHVRLLTFPYSMSDSDPSSEYPKMENIWTPSSGSLQLSGKEREKEFTIRWPQ